MDYSVQAETARRLLRMRALRWDYFLGDMFDEHGWNLLMILFVGYAEGRVMKADDAVAASGASRGVGERWFRHLVKADLVVADPAGSEAVQLTDIARADMAEYLTEAARILGVEESLPGKGEVEGSGANAGTDQPESPSER